MSHVNVKELLSGAVAVAFNARYVSTGTIEGTENDTVGVAGIIFTVKLVIYVVLLGPYTNVAFIILVAEYTGNLYDIFRP